MTSDRLSLRALNRATLERQLLLRRASLPARQAVGQLAGLQAQAPLAPYVGLWTRLAGFRPHHLKDLLTERALVRAHLMRNTVHLVTAEDFVSFRPLFQPKIDRDLAGNFGRNLKGVDLAEVRQAARALLAERPLTRGQLAAELAPGWPDHDPASLAYAATHLLPLVQVPPRGLWGENGQATFFLADVWLDGLEDAGSGSPPDPARLENAREQLVLRYLAATLLVDGLWQADWKIIKGEHEAVLQIRPFIRLSAAEMEAIAAEGELLLDFAGPAGTGPATGSSTGHDVRFAPVS